ncbi:Hypothetical_protein [Hexamita inflata]|uniref:Hypothetical_protein n=1 Tax=Hexamita inflata TaxID=28002 RepID=A0ABP1J4W2_9EUKA
MLLLNVHQSQEYYELYQISFEYFFQKRVFQFGANNLCTNLFFVQVLLVEQFMSLFSSHTMYHIFSYICRFRVYLVSINQICKQFFDFCVCFVGCDCDQFLAHCIRKIVIDFLYWLIVFHFFKQLDEVVNSSFDLHGFCAICNIYVTKQVFDLKVFEISRKVVYYFLCSEQN